MSASLSMVEMERGGDPVFTPKALRNEARGRAAPASAPWAGGANAVMHDSGRGRPPTRCAFRKACRPPGVRSLALATPGFVAQRLRRKDQYGHIGNDVPTSPMSCHTLLPHRSGRM